VGRSGIVIIPLATIRVITCIFEASFQPVHLVAQAKNVVEEFRGICLNNTQTIPKQINRLRFIRCQLWLCVYAVFLVAVATSGKAPLHVCTTTSALKFGNS